MFERSNKLKFHCGIRKVLFILFLSVIFFGTTDISNAQYQPLAPIPGFVEETVSDNDLNGYLNGMFKLGIALAVGLAVVMIIIGGIQYMSTDAIGKKEDGKGRITAAVVGLLVALGSYMLLNTLDPKLLSTELTLDYVNNLHLGGGQEHGKIRYEEDDEYAHYTHYEDGTIRAKYKDGTTIDFDKESDSQSPSIPSTPINSEDLNKYKTEGCIPSKDKSGRSGNITPSAAYMKDNLPRLFPGTEIMSDYRSPQHNHAVGGAKGSAHMRGDAIDIADGNSRMNTALGLSIVNWAKQHGQELGLSQIIFQDKFYNSPDGGKTWVTKGGATGHYNHVHIGGRGNCN